MPNLSNHLDRPVELAPHDLLQSPTRIRLRLEALPAVGTISPFDALIRKAHLPSARRYTSPELAMAIIPFFGHTPVCQPYAPMRRGRTASDTLDASRVVPAPFRRPLCPAEVTGGPRADPRRSMTSQLRRLPEA